MFETLLASWPMIIITLAMTAGGLWVFRRANVKQLGEMQDKIIATYKLQNEAQELQIQGCEKEIARLKRVVSTIQYALKRRGLRIEIDADNITLIDSQTQGTRTTTVRIDSMSEHDNDNDEEAK